MIFFSVQTLAMPDAVCNHPGKKNSSIISIKPNMEYCFERYPTLWFVNLTNDVVRISSEYAKVYEVYPYTSARIAHRIHILSYGDGAIIGDKRSIVLTPIKNDKKKALKLFRDYISSNGHSSNIEPKVVPVMLIPAITGAAAGAIGTIADSIMSDKDLCSSDIIINTVSGAVAGAAVPIMTPGFIGGIAAAGLGVSAKGMCVSCHKASLCGGGRH